MGEEMEGDRVVGQETEADETAPSTVTSDALSSTPASSASDTTTDDRGPEFVVPSNSLRPTATTSARTHNPRMIVPVRPPQRAGSACAPPREDPNAVLAIRLESIMASAEKVAELQAKAWPQINEAIKEARLIMDASLESKRLEIQKLTVGSKHKDARTNTSVITSSPLSSGGNHPFSIERILDPDIDATSNNNNTRAPELTDRDIVTNPDATYPEINRNNLTTDISNQINQTFGALAKTIESTNSTSKASFKRDYTLTSKANINVWLDRLNSELSAKELLDVIDSNTRPKRIFDVDEVDKRNRLVRDIIINHLDENYHKIILNINDPKEILTKIREHRRIEANTDDAKVREELYSIKINKQDKVSVFIDKFDSIIREYELCDIAIPLTDAEKTSAFMKAVKDTYPRIREMDIITKQTKGRGMNFEEMKNFIRQLEADLRSSGVAKGASANVARPGAAATAGAGPSGGGKCFRCDRFNVDHVSDSCPLIQYGLWFCYICRDFAHHTGRTCPRGDGSHRGGEYVANNNNNNRESKESKGRVNYRGNRGKYNNNNRESKESKGRVNYRGNRGKYNRGNGNSKRGKGYYDNNRDNKNRNPRGRNNGRVGKRGASRTYYPCGDKNKQKLANAVVALTEGKNNIDTINNKITFLLDSGATEHIKNKAFILRNFKKSSGTYIKSANKNKSADIEIDGKGDLYLKSLNNEGHTIRLSNVIAAPDISENLISLRKFVDAGFSIYLDDKNLKIFDKNDGSTFLTGYYKKPNWLIQLEVKNKIENSDRQTYNKYYCRARLITLENISKDPQNVETENNKDIDSEVGRELVTNESIPKLSQYRDFENYSLDDLKNEKPMDDLFTSFELEKRYSEELDEGMLWHNCEVCTMSKMSKQPFKEIRTRADHPLQLTHTDIIGPFKTITYPGRKKYIIAFIDDFSKFAKTYAISNKSEAGECLENYLNSMRNLTEFKTPLNTISPNKKNHLEKIRRFGCIAYAKKPLSENKLSENAIKGILVGQTKITRECNKDSNSIPNDNDKETPEETMDIFNTGNSESIEQLNDTESIGKQLETNKTNKRKRIIDHISEKHNRVQPKRSSKIKRDYKAMSEGKANLVDNSFAFITQYNETEVLGEDEKCYCLMATLNSDPTNYKEAMETKDKMNWSKAINDELESMRENNVWNIVERSSMNQKGNKANIIGSRWVLKRKIDSEGKTTFKARLVVRGFKDTNEYELRETYAPVSRLSIIRAAFAIIIKLDLEVCQLDVKTAFLNGELEEEIYMEIPDGLMLDKHTKENRVCKLHKAIYSLKISPKKWNQRFSTEVEKLGLQRDINEPCLFTYRKNGVMILLILYVDDILLAGNNSNKINEVKRHLSSVFKMKELGEPKEYLSIQITRDREAKQIMLSQSKYTKKVLERFNMNESKPQNTPMITRQVKARNNKNMEKAKQPGKPEFPYREAIGSLMYLANVIRPDIALAVNLLARKQSNPTIEDWIDVKRIMRYLRGSSDLGLIYRGVTENLEVFTDTSFRDNADSSSTSGMVARLFGDSVMWRSHKQSVINLSTCHAEYYAMSEACQEMISLDKALRDI
ncbi:uncharacterized protein LOC131675743 [Phymastichus coffea]|uniref:uncharacterized protein LOC131675743 n=1 Tax=Phymastichus coffea TaxID=108790 RepID=UPI00273CE44C|nr:uncharacterized protein LOC131675743 [Phymastichus coffea]